MVRAMQSRAWWYRGLVYLTLVSLIWGQAVWPVWSLVGPLGLGLRGWAEGGPWSGSIAQAAVLTWDADTTTPGAQDGAGTWNTSNTNWWDGTGNVAWNNSLPDSAVIGAGSGAAGTITVSGTINVAGITFAAPGSGNYTLSGGTLRLTSPTIDVATGLSPTIGSVIAGTAGLTKTGAGTLVLTGSNTYSGGTTISGGVLAGSSIANQGTNSSFGVGNFTLSNNATLRYTGSSASTDRSFTLGTGGGQLEITTSGATLTVSGALSGSTNLTVLGPTSGTGTLVLSGTNSAYSGVIRPGTNTVVQINSAAALGGAGVVLNGGTARIYGASGTLQDLGVNGLNAYYYNVGVTEMNSLDDRFATEQLIIPDRVIQRVDTHPMTLNLPVAVNTD